MAKSSTKGAQEVKAVSKPKKKEQLGKLTLKNGGKQPETKIKVVKKVAEPIEALQKNIVKKSAKLPGGDGKKAEKIAPRVAETEVKAEPRGKKSKMVKRSSSEDSALPVQKKPKILKNGVKKTAKPTKSTKSAEDKPQEEPVEEKGVKKAEKVEKNVGNLEMTESHVRQCVEAILLLANKPSEGKKSLLPEDDSVVFLQVNCIKIPKVPRRQLRIFLPHKMVGLTDEVALFVPDLERGLRKDYEKTVDHWETILRSKNVTQIKEVIPMNRVKTEYSQYEMKLKLGRMFDFFLVDGRIAGHMSHLLGKTFRRSARPPTPVKLQRDNLKSEIDFALRKTCMEIHGAGNCHTMQVASASMSPEEISENIMAACKGLEKEYPGGWGNIRSVIVKTTRGMGIPVYFSVQNKNKVRVPKISAKRPKAFKAVEGELSTTLKDVIVRVEPGGEVTLKKVESLKVEKA